MAPLQELPARAKEILARPGFLIGEDAFELRNLLANLNELLAQTSNELGHMCLSGNLVGALGRLTARDGRPDLTWRSQPLGLTYADLLVAGFVGRAELDESIKSNYVKLLNILLSSGVPVNNTDFSGRTALHHAAKRSAAKDLVKVLLDYGASVDFQDRFGATPLLIAIQEDAVAVITTLLDRGANLDIPDGEGISPRSTYPTRPVGVSNVVRSWLVQNKGKEAVIEGGRCSKCGNGSKSMKRCSRCRSQLYCSPECQAADWKEHKKNCQSFDKEEDLVIVKPGYTFGNLGFASTISVVPSTFGHTQGPSPSGRFEPRVRDGRNMVIKVQLPLEGNGGMLVYNKTRSFQCTLSDNENPTAYTRLQTTIKAKGIFGLKAYFQAELRSKDQLAINVAECLPESKF